MRQWADKRDRERKQVRNRCGATGKVMFKTHAAALQRGGEILTSESRSEEN